jgi:hypothetical protein
MAETNPLDEVARLVECADRYDDQARIALRTYCQEHREIWPQVQFFVTQVEAELVQLAAGDDPTLTSEIVQGLAGIRAQLAGQNPTPVERAVVDLVALRWPHWQHASALSEEHRGSSWRLRERLRHRQNHCRRRYHAGLGMLAKVQRLLAIRSIREDRIC